MAFFMKLTIVDNREVFVNVDLITRIEPLPNYTAIYFDQENAVSVKETAHHIIGELPDDRSTRSQR
jgi:uncharacterized protein YlzI (FlbEa/FlbD family)